MSTNIKEISFFFRETDNGYEYKSLAYPDSLRNIALHLSPIIHTLMDFREDVIKEIKGASDNGDTPSNS